MALHFAMGDVMEIVVQAHWGFKNFTFRGVPNENISLLPKSGVFLSAIQETSEWFLYLFIVLTPYSTFFWDKM